MSLPAAIATFLTLDVALIGLLAFVMSRAARLTPHAPAATPLHRREAHHREQIAREQPDIGVLSAA